MLKSTSKTLLKSADEADRKDSYSKVALYAESEYTVSSNKGLKDLIASVINLIENIDYRSVIETHPTDGFFAKFGRGFDKEAMAEIRWR